MTEEEGVSREDQETMVMGLSSVLVVVEARALRALVGRW